jgi:hypothetical protein
MLGHISVRTACPETAGVFEVAFQLNAGAFRVVVGDRFQ